MADQIDSYLAEQRIKFTELMRNGTEEDVVAFIDHLEHEEGYVFFAAELRKVWEDQQYCDSLEADRYVAGYSADGNVKL